MENLASSGQGSASAAEIAKFGALAPRWWDPDGPMWPLHRMNPLRVGWIDARLRREPGASQARVLDIGCGAGLAAEALAELGHSVLGLDASAEAIAVAEAHAAGRGLDLTYRVGLAEDLLAEGWRGPNITALEIIEHVPDPAEFLRLLAGLLAPGGLLVVSTLNRTLRSLAVGKIGAEYIARVLPAGTHDFRKFVKPHEMAAMGRAAGLRLVDLAGMSFNPMSGKWRESRDMSVNYIAAFAN